MKAILKFRDYQNKDLISGISQAQNEGTHINLNGANDFNGRSSKDRVDLLAPYDCVIKAISNQDNTCFFESLSEVETPSGKYSHCWFMATHILDSDFTALRLKVGRTFKQGEPCYTEGNKGIGSGYHIHLEQGIGTFSGTTLPYYKSNDTFTYGGVTYNQYYPCCDGYECPITDMFYIEEGIEKVKGLSGNDYVWHVVNESDPKDNNNFVEGYQVLSWLGQTIHVYKQKDNEDIGLLSGDVKDITEFSCDYPIKAIVNCHYFNNHISDSEYGQIYGRCQGFNANATTDKTSGSKPYMDLVITKDNDVIFGDFNSWDYTDVKVGVSPAAIQLDKGKVIDEYSPACGYGKVTTPNTQTLLLKCNDGKFALAVVSGNLSLYQCKDFAVTYGCSHLSAYDSGGSSQMVIEGSKKVYTGRKIPTCLIMYEKPKDNTSEIEDIKKRIKEYQDLIEDLEKQLKELGGK